MIFYSLLSKYIGIYAGGDKKEVPTTSSVVSSESRDDGERLSVSAVSQGGDESVVSPERHGQCRITVTDISPIPLPELHNKSKRTSKQRRSEILTASPMKQMLKEKQAKQSQRKEKELKEKEAIKMMKKNERECKKAEKRLMSESDHQITEAKRTKMDSRQTHKVSKKSEKSEKSQKCGMQKKERQKKKNKVICRDSRRTSVKPTFSPGDGSKKPRAGGKKLQKSSSPQSCADEAIRICCPACEEQYTDPPVEDWIQCGKCQKWWHDDCTSYEGGDFVCDLCM